MSKIFHEASGRHADHKTVTNAMEKDYPMEFIIHRCVEKDLVAKKARVIWLKIIEVVSYFQKLPKNKQAGLGKPGAKTLMRKFTGKGFHDKSCSAMAKLDSTMLIIRNLPT